MPARSSTTFGTDDVAAIRVRRFQGRCSAAHHPWHPVMTIDGNHVATSATTVVLNPATEEIIAHAPECSRQLLDAAVIASAVAFKRWSATPIESRCRAILSFADAVEQRQAELADLLVLEQGKPFERATGEITSALAHCRAICQFALNVEVLENSQQRRIELHRRPIGVVGAIVPWNYPVLLSFWKIAPALLAGNTVILKPAPTTPLTALKLGEISRGVLPHGVLNVVTGADVGPWLASHPGVQKISFTGSIGTGKKVMAAAAPTLKRLTLELGGNDAGVVLSNIDLDRTIDDLFWAAFSNCGQVCSGLKRLYVPASLIDEVCVRLETIARSVVMGDGRCEGVQMGPVQNQNQHQRVMALVDRARNDGASVLTGGQPISGKGYFYPPTIVRDVHDGDALIDEEQFGPVLPVIAYRDLDDAVRRANATRYGLGGSVWGRDVGLATAVAKRLECGSAWVNQHPSIAPHVPFGGIKESGLGVELSRYGLEAYTDIFVLNAKKSA